MNSHPPQFSPTQSKILDAAEHLFAGHGLHATTLREITSAAEVNLASVNYHFGSKEKLIRAVLLRRLAPLNEQREHQLQQVLDQAASCHRAPTTAEILRSFIEPTLRFAQADPAHQDFMTMVSCLMMTPGSPFRRLFLDMIEPLIGRLFQALKLANPQLSDATLRLRLRFTFGAIITTMRNIPLPLANQPQPTDSDLDQVIDELSQFVSRGMEGK